MDAERYDPQQVEPKWVAAWEELALYRATRATPASPASTLGMFPYPSGDLHMGHLEAFSGGDESQAEADAGLQRAPPVGWDAFGLPAENDISTRGPPDLDLQNIDAQRATFHRLGSPSTGRGR